ncbi:MAG: metallophosphoesterase [Solirubrobacterales bacterium]|jgi:serine/threonine protein phosphatase 1
MPDRPGRLFVCGDIHGCLEQLLRALKLVGFDRERDTLWALGDLVDRGPDSEAVFVLLNEPWFRSIKGNHEVMMEQAFDQGGASSAFHIRFGGGWFALLEPERQAQLAAMVRDLPVAVTLASPSGRSIGLVHADVPFGDWRQFMQWLATERVQDTAMWSRATIDRVLAGEDVPRVTGVDQVYLGHTPIADPIDAENMRFIDTKCFETGRLTLEEVL